MAKSRGDVPDEVIEGSEAQRVRRALVDPDRAFERRRTEVGPHETPERAREMTLEKGDGEWIDRGVTDAKLSRIDRREYADVWETDKTHKYSKEEIDASLKGLQEARSRLKGGASPSELRELARSTDPKEKQIGRSYKTYYERDPITVDLAADGGSTVEKGRHRLARADRLGYEELPMRVLKQNRPRVEG